MRRNAIVTGVVVIAVLGLAAQLGIPAYVSSRVEDRLTENGGTAHAEVRALPALRLLGGDGDSIEITGRDLRFDFPAANTDAFDRLDGFDEVDASLTRLTAGPFDVERFELRRAEGEESYRMLVQASATPDALTEYAGGQLGGPLGGLLGRFADGVLPFGDDPIPLSIDARVRSDGGRPVVVRASGDVLGIPAGPLAQAIAGAVAARL
jgi:type II secretory pathway pseudopilin PulG